VEVYVKKIYLFAIYVLWGYIISPKRKTPKKILRGFLVALWLAGVQPVRNTRAVLSMVSASDDTLFPKGRLVSNHKTLYLDRLFASTISKGSVKDCGLNHSKVATLI
jgi:hypothetical protein